MLSFCAHAVGTLDVKAAIPIGPMHATFAGSLQHWWPRLRYALLLTLAASTVLTVFELVGVAFSNLHLPADYTGYSELGFIASWFAYNAIYVGPVALASILVSERLPEHGAWRWIWLGITVLVSTVVGPGLGAVLDPTHAESVQKISPWQQFLEQWIQCWFPAALLVSIYEFHRHGVRAMEEAFRARAGRAALDAELSRTQLQLLRAQVEPHFLVNTLANLRRLYGLDPAAGRELLHSLRQYLTASLPGLRAEQSSLRSEAALIGAYLDIFRVRMGARLKYEIAFPAELLDVPVPPMMLLTLVENAIKHGLSPLPEGGSLHLSARVRDRTLELCVADSGRGMGESSGQGTGLANIRGRLAAMYGTAAELSLSLNQPHGMIALLRLPLPVAG